MEPSEVDDPAAVAAGNPVGVKHAAIRKLYQELGIAMDTFSVDDFKFLTRLHYWAADTVTHGAHAPWGEHEIDYVLFVTIDNKKYLRVVPHPDEVDAVQWVNARELQSMLQDEKLLFSPWFRLIVKKWLYTWWANLDETMTTNKHCDCVSIHEFDPPVEHFGGQGNAQALFVNNSLQGDSR
jgi:isopentenyl-diphosphate delta-isomerase type 1